MPDTKFEQAKRCPRCKRPGEKIAVHPQDDGSKVHVFSCRTEGCRWENTQWLVQVMRDGSIPERKPGEKQFEHISESLAQKARDLEKANREVMQSGEVQKRGR